MTLLTLPAIFSLLPEPAAKSLEQSQRDPAGSSLFRTTKNSPYPENAAEVEQRFRLSTWWLGGALRHRMFCQCSILRQAFCPCRAPKFDLKFRHGPCTKNNLAARHQMMAQA